MPTPNASKRAPVVLGVRVAGLGIALALGVMAVFRLPCLAGGCDAVLASRWATWFGVPLGFYGAALWFATFLPTPRVRIVTHHLLAAGSLGLVALQVWAVGRFCPWCVAHAALCFIAWPLRGEVVARKGIFAGVALAAVMVAGLAAMRQPPAVAPAPTELIAQSFDWLTPQKKPSRVLVVSLTCPVCLDLLGHLPDAVEKNGFGLVWLTSTDNRALTEQFVASVLAHPAGPLESFPALVDVLLTQKDLVIAQPGAAATWWQTTMASDAAVVTRAAAQLTRQQAALARAGLKVTPVMVEADGKTRSIAHAHELE